MKVTAYDFGKCGLTNLFYAGTIKFGSMNMSNKWNAIIFFG